MKQPVLTSVKSTLQPVDSKRLIDTYLQPFLALKVDEAKQLDPAYATLWSSIERLYLSGGKRLRSYMTLLVFQAYSEAPLDTILPAAAAQELLHLAMLMHDDIIDRDLIRYGTENVTGQYIQHYEQHIEDEHDRLHFAESAAILAGDLLLTEALVLTAESIADPKAIVAAQKILAKAIFTVIGGELLDTEASFKKTGIAHPLVIAEHKTASYSFVAPFTLGATLAHAPREDIATLEKLGQQLGIAYQLRDDVLGVFGNQTTTGKSADGDIKEGKRTILIEAFDRLATDEQKAIFYAIFGSHTTDEQTIQTARTLLKESGALESLESTIAEYSETVKSLIQTLDISETSKQAFHALATLCLQRER